MYNIILGRESVLQADGKLVESGEFTLRYGDAHLHVGGLPALLGAPTGITERQLEQQVEREHTEVELHEWGGSDRELRNGNYEVVTTPAREWKFATVGTWVASEGQPYKGPLCTAPGAFVWSEEHGRWEEDERKRRHHVDMRAETLYGDMSRRMNQSRCAWAESQGCAVEELVAVTEEAVANTSITRLELVCTCCYTGPMYSLFNTGAQCCTQLALE